VRIIPEDLSGGRRSITAAIQVCTKIDGLKYVPVCYMVRARKTDAYAKKASGDHQGQNGTASAVQEKNDGKRLS
jgi:hypothetical protein